jgi:imidazolonepropionase-like amidohydrolase
MQLLLSNAVLVDATLPEPRHGHVLIEDGVIRDLNARVRSAEGRIVLDLRGYTLMPGLIDCHVHVVASMMNLSANAQLPDATAMLRCLPILRGMLARGFTTVRDAGGAPYALAQGIEQGLAEGPRLIVCGKALSRTGGHTDYRQRADTDDPYRWQGKFGSIGRIADGADEVRRAARQELRQGAHFIKIMANGGVSSPTDPVAWIGYSADEILAAVQEAADAQTYVSAHLYTAPAIMRAVQCGVHSLEHCNVIDAEAAAAAAAKGCVAVPTLVVFEALAQDGERLGLPSESRAKIADVRYSGLASLKILWDAGVPMAYGTDLLGESHERQSEEFAIRAQVLPPREVLSSATTTAAKLIGMQSKLGRLHEGFLADLIAVEGNPLENGALLADPLRNLKMVIQGGEVRHDRLH